MDYNKQTKYTHITERCNSLIRTFTAMRLESLTGDTFSSAYWRLREGKGLLTPSEKQHLELWCRLITMVRKGSGCPVPLTQPDHADLVDLRDELLEKMEEYRNWLSNGSKPLYLHRCEQVLLPVSPTRRQVYGKCTYETLPFALTKHLENIGVPLMDISTDQQREVLSLVDFDQLKVINEEFAEELVPHMASKSYTAAMSAFLDENPDIYVLPNDKVWQIRADMDHRSSRGANINFTLNWIESVPSKSADHDEAYSKISAILAQLVLWQKKSKVWYRMEKEKGIKPEINSKEYLNYIKERLLAVMDAIPKIK